MLILCRCVQQHSKWECRICHSAHSSCSHYAERRRGNLLRDSVLYKHCLTTNAGIGTTLLCNPVPCNDLSVICFLVNDRTPEVRQSHRAVI